ncbi:DUF1440 domain-containing protein [Streptomyces sp. TRM70350]|uniref:DUF1440 domain-containing protein n=1 Tax=Streptomyces sp. TRM70350 TaxID=2856165 RepID=UPI001C467444|nr:DUF1440 domain-containing protein [Streptomyces sp. TRM70350]MBV7697833.1 DUF1440 domain-containing protein [Streptomyces sp. TRM70350]
MTGPKSTWSSVSRAGARGLVAAMAMTGSRTVAAGIAPGERTPPQAIVEKEAPVLFSRMGRYQREAVTELLHWAYGAGGGMAFGLLPARIRRFPGTGVAYGLTFWLAFEAGIAPLLGIERGRHRKALWLVVIALDHVLYGVVVAGRLAPEQAIDTGRAEDRGDD